MIRTLSMVALLTAWLVSPALASNVQQQQSVLYPYQSTVELQDEFVSGSSSTGLVGSLGWFVIGTGSTLGGEANEPGVHRRDTSAVSGTVSALLLSAIQTQLVSTLNFNQLFRIRINNNDANTTVRIGLENACTLATPNSGIYFEKLDADTNWFAVTNNAGTATRTDTGIATSTTGFNVFTIDKNATRAEFQINGVITNTISTNLPTASLQPCGQIVNSAAASKTMDIGYFQLRITGLGR